MPAAGSNYIRNYYKYLEDDYRFTFNLDNEDGDLKQRQKLQHFVFPSGLGYDKSNDLVRTPKVNAIFGSIPILSKKISNIKKGEPIPVNQFSDLVTQTYKSSNLVKALKSIF